MITPIPTRVVGPMFILAETWQDDVSVPLATFETTLWPSTQRGAKLSKLCGGIRVVSLKNNMTRSIVLKAPSVLRAKAILNDLREDPSCLHQAVAATSRFAKLEDFFAEIVGRNLYLRFAFFTGDASGHNMTTKAADAIIESLLQQFKDLTYVSISANICVDKKVSSINALLGRGKHVIAEMTLSRAICQKYLRTTPEQLRDLNLSKNWIGSVLSGGVRSANAHYANMLLAAYLATGQDAANIVEGSQGLTHIECSADCEEVYFSVNIPNIIVGTIGNGKHHPEITERLKLMGCTPDPVAPGKSAERLAEIIAATVLCGELSLLAAQTNRGELTKSHMLFERLK